MAGMSATRISGLILIIGALLMIVATLFRPGSYLIEPDFASDTKLRDAINHTVVIVAVKTGIAIIAGYGYLFGFTFMGLGLYLRFTSGAMKLWPGWYAWCRSLRW